MTVLAGEIIAGIAHGGVGGVLADMAGGIDDQILAVADEIVLRPRSKLGDIGGVPIDRPVEHIMGYIIGDPRARRGPEEEPKDNAKARPLSHPLASHPILLGVPMIATPACRSASPFGDHPKR
jgi:hypothetical protein